MDEAAERWLNSLKPATRRSYGRFWPLFLEFTGLTGDQILASRKADEEYHWEGKVLEFKHWLLKRYSENSATTMTNVARSFFSFHRQTLQFRRSESQQVSEAKRKTEDYRFSREDLKQMFDVANLKEKYVLTVGKSFGLRAGDFLSLTRGDLEPYLDRKPPISIGEYYTQKEKVKAYPFIDVDALPIVKLMIQNMDREGKTGPTERILTYTDPIQLTRIIKRVAKRAGIKHGNKVIRFHCLRKFLCDRLASFMSDSKWKQIVGKKIPESAYISPDLLREDYIRAMDHTCFEKAISKDEMEKIAKKQAILALLGMSEEEVKHIFTMKGIGGDLNKEIKVLQDIAEEQRRQSQTNNDCANEVNCPTFKEIHEDELLSHLQDGWRITHTLQNGKLIIRKG